MSSPTPTSQGKKLKRSKTGAASVKLPDPQQMKMRPLTIEEKRQKEALADSTAALEVRRIEKMPFVAYLGWKHKYLPCISHNNYQYLLLIKAQQCQPDVNTRPDIFQTSSFLADDKIVHVRYPPRNKTKNEARDEAYNALNGIREVA